MKTFYHILTLIFLISVINSTYGQDLKSYKLKGNVKSYRETDYEVIRKYGEVQKGNKLIDDSHFDIFTSFNISGKKIDYISYKSNSDVKDRTTYKRDVKGNILEEVNLNNTVKYKYNQIGKVIEVTTLNSDGTISTGKYKYDENGNCTIYNQDGSIKHKEIYKNGHLVEEIDYYSESGGIMNKYDEQGNVIELSVFMSDGTVISKQTIKNDSNGNEIQSTSEDMNTYSFYDSNGNTTESNTYYNNGSSPYKCSYTYVIDTHGNWIREIKYENGQPTKWTERIIEYYQ
jgi:YD repeat-containing protein